MRGILLRLSLTCLVLGGVIMTTWDTAMAQQRHGKYTFKQKKLKSVRKQNRKLSRNNPFDDGMNVFHLAGVGSLTVGIALGEETAAGELVYDIGLSERFFSRTGLMLEWGDVFDIPYKGYYLHQSFGSVLFDMRKRYYLNALLGVTGVYDDYTALEVLDNRWNFGLHYGLELEVGISPMLATTLNTRQLIMRDSPNRWVAAFGLKFRLH